MPVYEYKCDSCGKSFSKLVLSSSSKVECKSCGSKKLTRQFSTFSAHGNGSKPDCRSSDTCPSAQIGGCPSGGCPFGGH